MAEAISTSTENKNLDYFYPSILAKEPSVRLECFPALENYLSDVDTSLECDDLTGFINGLLKWIEGSNFRIAYNGLRAIEMFVDRLDSNEFERYVDSVIPITVDRLGDAKDQVREAASNLLIKLMTTYPPQRIWDLIQPLAFDNKQFRIKEESQRLLIRSLDEFGASAVQLSKLVPLICKLVSDSNGTVRQQAIDTLVEIYRHVGEKVRNDIAKRDIPEAKLKQLYEKFDDVIANGRMIAKVSEITTDDSRPKSSSTTTTRSRLGSDSSTTSVRTKPNGSIPTRASTASSAAAASGAVDEAIFEEAFNTTPNILLTSGKDVENHLSNIRDILADTNNDWEKRVDALKKLRSVIASGGLEYDEFLRNLRQLDLPLVSTVKDLRSQIVREACITLAYMSIHLTNRFERTAENVLPAMLSLIQNSAKVIATSGTVGVRYIITNTQSVKLVPLILTGVESKSKEIRRQTYEVVIIMLSQWDFVYLDKHGQSFHDGIKKGLSDADPEARSHARKSFQCFREHFPTLADALLATLDPSKKKTLLGEMSNASSTHSLASVGSSRIRSAKEVTSKQNRTGVVDKQDSASNISRSSSANELALKKKNSGLINTASTQSTTSRPRHSLQSSNITKPPTPSSRPSQTVSQSTPGSRSTSPNSLRSSTTRTPTSARTRIPIGSNNGSRISSRESSPGRTPSSVGGNRRRYGRYRGGVGSEYGDHPSGRRVSGSWYGDSGDDASETSSICSERAIEDIADILRRLASSEWAERKESLVSLHHMIRAGRTLSPPELKRLTELLTKRFYDPHSQVFAAFLDVLPEFIIAYKRELNDWLYILLTRLLIRMGAQDLLDSVYKKLKQSLSIVNSSFDVHGQFNVLIRFINDNSSAPGLKVKELLLRYLQQILQHMEPVDITNNQDIRNALIKILNWSNEPKSLEMRKAAQAVTLTLHNLNRPEFNLMLTELPQNYQDTASKIIQNGSDTPLSTPSPFDSKYDFFHRSSFSGLTSPMSTSMHSDMQTSYASDMRILMENMQALNVNNHQDDLLLTNATSNKPKEKHSMIPIRQYTPQSYRSLPSQSQNNETSDHILNAPDRPAAIDMALNIANSNAAPKDQRQHALRCILKFARLKDNETWDVAFNKTLNILTQLLDNTTDDIIYKVYSLRIIRELLTHQTNLFFNYIELIIFRILKAQSENESEITRAAEQAAHAAAEHFPAEETFRVLKPIIEQAKFPMNQSAITMLQKTIELMNKDLCLELMPEMIPPLLTVWDCNSHNLSGAASSWDNETSSVRKAAVFCLVAIYLAVGEALRTHLHKLSASKLKLLNVYISKAQQTTTTTTTNGTDNKKDS